MTERNEVTEVTMKNIIGYSVTVSKNPWGVPIRCVAVHGNSQEVEIPVLYVHWANTVAKVYELQKLHNLPHEETGFVQLVKALRSANLGFGLYESKKLVELLVHKQTALLELPASVIVSSYTEETQGWPEYQAEAASQSVQLTEAK